MKREYRVWIGVVGVVLILAGLLVADSIYETDVQKKVVVNRITGREQGLTMQGIGPYQIDESSATNTYIRYTTGSGNVLIKRINVDGNVTSIERTWTNWASRATATYTAINN